MQFWWFRRKWSQIKSFIQFIKIVPDIKTRTFVAIFFSSFVIFSFFIGLSLGRYIESRNQIEIIGLSKHETYNSALLAKVSDSGSLYAKSESDKNIVASDSGSVYYYKSCKVYTRIKEENRVWFKTKEEAELSGYRLAKNCKDSL